MIGGQTFTLVLALVLMMRQRDAAQREALGTTIRSMRADVQRQTTEMERLNDKYAESQRRVNISDSSERALRAQLKAAETAVRGLKEEMARMRVLVGQTRASCANDVRKREKVIEALKKQVGEAGRVRGAGKTVGVATITIVSGVGAKEEDKEGAVALGESRYDLRSETNEFLTQLAKGLGEENEVLAQLARRTVESLREVSGWKGDGDGHAISMDESYDALTGEIDAVMEHLRHLLTNPSFVPIEEVEVREDEIARLRQGWEKMEARWTDAVSMMEGWRKRMARSGQTVNLEELDMGLMLSPLKPKSEEAGLMDDAHDTSMSDSILPDSQGEGDFIEKLTDSEDSLDEDEGSEDLPPTTTDEVTCDETAVTIASSSPGPAPQLSPLRETTNGNRGISPPRHQEFTTIMEENTYDLRQLDTSTKLPVRMRPVEHAAISETCVHELDTLKTEATEMVQDENQDENQGYENHKDEESYENHQTEKSYKNHQDETSKAARSSPPASPVKADAQSITRPHLSMAPTPNLRPSKSYSTRQDAQFKLDISANPSSRLPRPSSEHLPPQQSPLTMATIAAKLAATEREADAARVRAKLRAARAAKARPVTGTLASNGEASLDATVSNKEPPLDTTVKHENTNKESRRSKRITTGRGGASRRRSTLSPWELESLMLVGATDAGQEPGHV